MPPRIEDLLTAENGYLFRITHRDNLPGILERGKICAADRDEIPGFVTIGSRPLIDRRSRRPVPIAPGGTLSQYVPFYFTPHSPMAYNIHTGNQVVKRPNDEIVILATTVKRICDAGLPFVFTDRHAYLRTATYFADRSQLDAVDFPLLQRRNFQRSEEDPERVDRYQAEFLVHQEIPLSAVLAVACYTEEAVKSIAAAAGRLSIPIRVLHRPNWYF